MLSHVHMYSCMYICMHSASACLRWCYEANEMANGLHVHKKGELGQATATSTLYIFGVMLA